LVQHFFKRLLYTMSMFLYTSLLAGAETISMTALTKYSKNKDKNTLYLLLGVFIYGAIIPFLIIILLNVHGIGTVNFLWNIITTVSMIIIGYYAFGDAVSHLHFISLFLGISAIIVLMIAERKPK
jgi:multidrug transporter EmrE-like cation transporter